MLLEREGTVEEGLCLGCAVEFKRRSNIVGQKYCSRPECQRERKRLWQKDKLRCDGEYRSNQESAQEKWTKRNPGYWKRYRSTHLDYVACNRQRQRVRNRRRGKKTAEADCKNGRVNQEDALGPRPTESAGGDGGRKGE